MDIEPELAMRKDIVMLMVMMTSTFIGICVMKNGNGAERKEQLKDVLHQRRIQVDLAILCKRFVHAVQEFQN